MQMKSPVEYNTWGNATKVRILQATQANSQGTWPSQSQNMLNSANTQKAITFYSVQIGSDSVLFCVARCFTSELIIMHRIMMRPGKFFSDSLILL